MRLLSLRSFAALLCTASAVFACSSGGGGALNTTPGTTGAFSLTAAADGALPAGGKVVVIWSVSSGSPDYSYAFGSGSTQGTSVFVSFSADPPAEALNAGQLGIGFVAVIDANTTIAEGKLAKDQIGTLGLVSPRHAIIFRREASPAATKRGWDGAFPQGFACGSCVDHDAGFDSFEMVDCSAVKLVPYSQDVKFCNWT